MKAGGKRCIMCGQVRPPGREIVPFRAGAKSRGDGGGGVALSGIERGETLRETGGSGGVGGSGIVSRSDSSSSSSSSSSSASISTSGSIGSGSGIRG